MVMKLHADPGQDRFCHHTIPCNQKMSYRFPILPLLQVLSTSALQDPNLCISTKRHHLPRHWDLVRLHPVVVMSAC